MKTLHELFQLKSNDWVTSVKSTEEGLERIYATLVDDKFIMVEITSSTKPAPRNITGRKATKDYSVVRVDFGVYQEARLRVFDSIKQLAEKDIKRYARLSSVDITGGGDALNVFGIVLNKAEEFIKKHKPDIITFDGKAEGGRNKLYNKIAIRGGKKLKGYTYISKRSTWEDWWGDDEMVKVYKFTLMSDKTMKELEIHIAGYDDDGSPQMKKKKHR